MAWEPCKKCGKHRKVDIIIASDGWHQPPCYNCGDPGYVEPFEKEEYLCGNPECPKAGHCNGECAKNF